MSGIVSGASPRHGGGPIASQAGGWRRKLLSRSQRARTYRVAIGAMLAMFAIPPVVGLRVDHASFAAFLGLVLCFVPVLLYLRWRGFDRLFSAIEGFLLIMLLSVPILVLSYAAMRLGLRLADARLARWDAAFGLDAGAIVAATGSVPWLAALLGYGYSSFSFQIVALPILLALAGQRNRAFWFVAAFFLTCAVAIAITVFFPALGAYVHFALDADTLGTVNPFFGYHFLESFHAVRDDQDFILSLGVASGIVTFPSIHASTAVLCGYAAWTLPRLRIPFVVLNIVMFASAVTHGAHYVVDILAGGLVALAVIRWRVPPMST